MKMRPLCQFRLLIWKIGAAAVTRRPLSHEMNLFRLACILSPSFELRALGTKIITLFLAEKERKREQKRKRVESSLFSDTIKCWWKSYVRRFCSTKRNMNMRVHKCKMSSSLSDITFSVRWNEKCGTQAKALLNYAGAHLLFYTHTPETKKFQNHNFQNSKCARKRIMHVPCINLKWKMENGKWKMAKGKSGMHDGVNSFKIRT